MKVMFTCFAHNTHYYAVVPMAWALRAAGHEVRIVSQADLTDTIARSGLTAVPVSPPGWAATDPASPELFEQIYRAGTSHVQHFDFTGRDSLQWTWEHLLGVEHVMVAALYASMNNDRMIEGSVAFARSWQPDLVIAETYTFAGAVAARSVGAAHARLVWGPDNAVRARQAFLAAAARQPDAHREDPTADWLAGVLARYGREFDETVLTGQWTIDTTPPSGRLDTGLRTVGVRYVPYNGPSAVPGFLREPSSRRRVCLTFGLTEREAGRGVTSMADILEAVADLDAEFVATLDATQLADVTRVPDNVRVAEFVPLNDLLPTCSAIVHQGGCGTRSTAELHGVPQLILTDGWDTELKGEHLERVGAGLALPMAALTADGLRSRVARLLDEPSFAAGAEALRQEVLAEPAPNEVVPLIEKLTAAHRDRAAVHA
ncbi:activator-dependent family glycosyltransferase [Amycolatopsis sp. NPDC059027]|uniref:activator-dependent family glycosyltransferase n=1 Tax=Amycolatopsis sp. NPDC059027 TaxID=3346709 RepID=UPI003671A72E